MIFSKSRKPFGYGICVSLVLVIAVVFGAARSNGFVDYDDDQYVYENPQVISGLTGGGILWAFTHCHAGNWHPLTWLSHMLDTSLFGKGPMGPHFTNVVLHAANAVLLFLWLMRMTGAKWRSAFVAALFALHPLHVESVAWISERKDVLSTFFGLLALIFYARYAESSKVLSPRSKVFYGLTLLFFAMGLMSKPMLVTLPFVMLLLDYWPLGRFTIYDLRFTIGRLVVEKIPFFILSAASCAATIVAQKAAVQPLGHISLGIRAVNAIVSYTRYLGKMLWPVDLAIPYPHPGYSSLGLFALSVATIVAVAFLLVRFGKRFPFLVTGWLFYFGTLIPVIGLVQVGMQAMADRYTYLPLVGVFIVMTWGAAELAGRWRLPQPVMMIGAVVILAVCGVRTRNQLSLWRNSETLFRHSIAVTKDNDIAHYNLGTYYYGRGRLDDAIDNLRKALQIRPSYEDAMNNLASALAANGELEEAAAVFREALNSKPSNAELHYNLGNVLVMQNKLDEAVSEYSESLRLKSDDARAHNNLANVLMMQGRNAEAVQHFREALRFNPDHNGAKERLRMLNASP